VEKVRCQDALLFPLACLSAKSILFPGNASKLRIDCLWLIGYAAVFTGCSVLFEVR
jgi:hypothetical protein